MTKSTKIITSYGVRLNANKSILKSTLSIYRDALSYVIEIVNLEWDTLSKAEWKHSNDKVMHIEHLIHSTKSNTAKYTEFDSFFYKFPSYLRRSVIAEAIGSVSSYRSNYDNWTDKGMIGKPPGLSIAHNSYPTFYHTNMYKKSSGYSIAIKVYDKNDWVWLEVPVRKSDMDYLQKHKSDAKELSPTLQKRHKRWELRFVYEEKRTLTNKKDIIIAVDLGINTDAVVSAMCSDGTVVGRKFINFPTEKDRMYTLLNQIKRNQKRGNYYNPRLWALAKNKNRFLIENIANAIIDFAVLFNTDIIVFEYLDMTGKISGSKRQKLHMWRKRGIQTIVKTKAHLRGMRVHRVNAWGTSKYAFDGSGEVVRGELLPNGKKVYSNCIFSTGKEYNCDLNASYNIGARYFIREIIKPFSETERLALEAKVPSLARRTTCVLADLLSLHVVLDSKIAA